MKNLLIFGDSNTGPLARAFSENESSLNHHKIEIKPIGQARVFLGNFHKVTDENIEIYNKPEQPPVINIPFNHSFDKIVFSAPFHSMRFINKFQWNKHASYTIKTGSNKTQLISQSLIQACILNWSQHILKFLSECNDRDIKVSVLEAPRLFRHHPDILNQTWKAQNTFEMDALFRETIYQELKARSIEVIRLPNEAYDQHGFMLDRYKSEDEKDFMHGNAKFGLKQLLSLSQI